jgi:transketolase
VLNIEPLQPRLEAFGARVFVVDAHDANALAAPAEVEPDGRPVVVLCYSDPTRGLPLLNNRAPKLHYLRFISEEERESYRTEYEKMLVELKGS